MTAAAPTAPKRVVFTADPEVCAKLWQENVKAVRLSFIIAFAAGAAAVLIAHLFWPAMPAWQSLLIAVPVVLLPSIIGLGETQTFRDIRTARAVSHLLALDTDSITIMGRPVPWTEVTGVRLRHDGGHLGVRVRCGFTEYDPEVDIALSRFIAPHQVPQAAAAIREHAAAQGIRVQEVQRADS